MGNQCSTGSCLLKQEEQNEMKFGAVKEMETDSSEGVALSKVKHCCAGHVLQPTCHVSGKCGDCGSGLKDGVTVMHCAQCNFTRCEECYPLKTLEVGDLVRAIDGSKGFVNSEGVEVYKTSDEGRVRKFFKAEHTGQERIKIAWNRTGLTTTCPASKWPSRFCLVCRVDNSAEKAAEKAAQKEAGAVLALATSGIPIPQALPKTGVRLAATAVAVKNAETAPAVVPASPAVPEHLLVSFNGNAQAKEDTLEAAAVAAKNAETAPNVVVTRDILEALLVMDKNAASAVVAASPTVPEDTPETTVAAEQNTETIPAAAVQVVDVGVAPAKEVHESTHFNLQLQTKDLTQNTSDIDQGSTQAESELEDPLQPEKVRELETQVDALVGDFRGAPTEFWTKLHLRFAPVGIEDLLAESIEARAPLPVDESDFFNFTIPSETIEANAVDVEASAPLADTAEDLFSFTKPSKIEPVDVNLQVDESPDLMTEFQSAPFEPALVEDCSFSSKCILDDAPSKAIDSVLLAQAPFVLSSCEETRAVPWNFRPSVGTWVMTPSLIA